PRRLILEGHVSPPYERRYHDELFFYAVMGPDHLSLEVSRDFDGERLLDYLFEQLGASEEPPRTQVGGRQDEEEGACCWWNGASRPTGARPCSGAWKRLWANPWKNR
ncbi:MAG TPA: hypothetical protein VFC55_07910, partial [Desulfobaccales bacterium]|nr:hypothetical protein [Desulfobaccales bacterium]